MRCFHQVIAGSTAPLCCTTGNWSGASSCTRVYSQGRLELIECLRVQRQFRTLCRVGPKHAHVEHRKTCVSGKDGKARLPAVVQASLLHTEILSFTVCNDLCTFMEPALSIDTSNIGQSLNL